MLMRLGEQMSVHRSYLMCCFFQKKAWHLSGPTALVWLMLLRSLAIPANPNDILGISGCTEWRFGRVSVISLVKTDVN